MSLNLETGRWYLGSLLESNETKKYLSKNSGSFAFNLLLEKGSIEIEKKEYVYDSKTNEFKDPFSGKKIADEFEGYTIRKFQMYPDRILAQLEQLDDDNVPMVKSSIDVEDVEKRNGHGFWGNESKGYINNRRNLIGRF